MTFTFGKFISLEHYRKTGRNMVCAAQGADAEQWMRLFRANGAVINGIRTAADEETTCGKHVDGGVFVYERYSRKMYVESTYTLPLLFGKAAVL